jgi:hypothetical protein
LSDLIIKNKIMEANNLPQTADASEYERETGNYTWDVGFSVDQWDDLIADVTGKKKTQFQADVNLLESAPDEVGTSRDYLEELIGAETELPDADIHAQMSTGPDMPMMFTAFKDQEIRVVQSVLGELHTQANFVQLARLMRLMAGKQGSIDEDLAMQLADESRHLPAGLRSTLVQSLTPESSEPGASGADVHDMGVRRDTDDGSSEAPPLAA